jgi:hypothetical protein
VLDDQGAGICEEIERVRDQVIEIRGQDDVESTAVHGDQLGQDGVAKIWIATFTELFDLSLTILLC